MQIELARRLGWKMRDGNPYHVLVQRILKALEKAKLVTIERGQTVLTKKGKTTAENCLNKRVQTAPMEPVLFRPLNTSERGKR